MPRVLWGSWGVGVFLLARYPCMRVLEPFRRRTLEPLDEGTGYLAHKKQHYLIPLWA